MFWDPEPINNTSTDQPVWCLGRSYRLADGKHSSLPLVGSAKPTDAAQEDATRDKLGAIPVPPSNAPETPPESNPSSFSSSLAYGELPRDSGWPQSFIDDFEARFWMTYRSDFEPIPRSNNPQAYTALSLAMRIKNQLGDQASFSTDSGWGCMIRSGQSLLANALGILQLGRSRDTSPSQWQLMYARLTLYRLASRPGASTGAKASTNVCR